MRKFVYKYIIEFFVIITSLLISFYVEKTKARDYKTELRNHSITRLASNISDDIEDSKINLKIHSFTKKKLEYLFNNYDSLIQVNKDTVADCLRTAAKSWTIFIDNPEEYLTLRNSGLIELVEDDTLILLLQKKYSNHQVYKKYEDHINNANMELLKVLNEKTIRERGYSNDSHYRHKCSMAPNRTLSESDLNLVMHKAGLCKTYCEDIITSISRDSLILIHLNKLLERDKLPD